MPTISDLKDQARAFEQQGQVERALTVYQHILKHLEGTPAIIKVLPLYVKAGDLLAKLGRSDEAVSSFGMAAEHYSSTGAATRVSSLCAKIVRLAPDRTDVYTRFARLLIEHGHVGSARDVLAEYARLANMDRALETLDDLAGRSNSEVQPMLERLLESFEIEDRAEQAAERVSSHLQRVTDDLAGELTGVPEAPQKAEEEPAAEREAEHGTEAEEEPVSEEPATEGEPLTPPMLDLDSMPRQSSLLSAIPSEDEDEATDTDAPPRESDEQPAVEVTTDVSPTMETAGLTEEEGEESPVEQSEDDESGKDDSLDLLMADALSSVEGREEEPAETPGIVEVDSSEWTPDIREPSTEEAVAKEWAPEEELQPAARFPSDGYEAPGDETPSHEMDREDEQPVEEIAERVSGPEEPVTGLEEEPVTGLEEEPVTGLEEEPVTGLEEEPVTGLEEPASVAEDHESTVAMTDETTEAVEKETPSDSPTPPAGEEEKPVEVVRRPTRPPRMTLPQEPSTKSRSPILAGLVGFLIGAAAGAGATYFLVGGGFGGAPPETPTREPAAMVDTAGPVETPGAAGAAAEGAPVVADTEQSERQAAEPETQAVDTFEEPAAGSVAAAAEIEAPPTIPEELEPDTVALDAAGAEQQLASPTVAGNPIVVEGLEVDEVSEVESDGRTGYRVVHLLDWSDPLVIEAYRDTTVRMSTYVQIDVTPPDTVVGIRRLDGYMVYASAVMPEDSLRSLMSRLSEGERPDESP